MNAAEVEARIDKLDHAERSLHGSCRLPLTDLTEHLNKARPVRRWVATPLLATAIAAPQIWGEEIWSIWIFSSAIVGTVFMWLMQRILERAYPVLARESRIEALQTYFAPWRYSEHDEEPAA
jgi:hypothetical protein